MGSSARYVQLAGQHCLNPACPAFGASGKGKVYRHGTTQRGVPRFRCVTCGKTFCSTKGTVVHLLRHDEKQVVEAAAEVLLARQTVGEVAREYGVSHGTVKRWAAAVRGDPVVLSRVAQKFRDEVDIRSQALLSLSVELGLLKVEDVDVALFERARGRAVAYRGLLRALVARYGDVNSLLRALRPVEAQLRKSGGLTLSMVGA